MKIKILITISLILLAVNAYCQCCYPPNPHYKPRQYYVYVPTYHRSYPPNEYYEPRRYYVYAPNYQRSYPPNENYEPRQYSVNVPCHTCCMLNCNCTDPACINDHCCFDCEKCCAAFGNIGAGCYEPLGEPYMPTHLCGPRYMPRRDFAPPYGGGGYVKIADNVTEMSQAYPRYHMRRPILRERVVYVTRTYPVSHYRMRSYPPCHPMVKRHRYHITSTYPVCHPRPVVICHPRALMRPYRRMKPPVLRRKESCTVHRRPVKLKRYPVQVR